MAPGWKTICCATDFSEPSRFALSEAARLSREQQAELALVYVEEPLPLDAAEALSSPSRIAERAARETETKLAAWRKDAEELAGRPVKAVVLVGKAAFEIDAFVRKHAVDLLVISTHGRTGLKHVLLGSVAEQLVRSSRVPVLVVPFPGARP